MVAEFTFASRVLAPTKPAVGCLLAMTVRALALAVTAASQIHFFLSPASTGRTPAFLAPVRPDPVRLALFDAGAERSVL